MKEILGLDLGTNSIGWAVVNKETQKILDAGVRIFQEGVVKETIGKGDNEISKNAERRSHRQARRLNYRKRLRKIKLLQTLIDLNMCPITHADLKSWKNWDKTKKSEGKQFPSNNNFILWLKQNPYELRTRAIKEEISRFELGRIFYHFIQRRGFLSSRKGKEDGTIYKGKDNMEGIDDTKKMIDSKPLGTRLFDIYPTENKPFKRIQIDGKDVRIRGRYTLREMYIEEFELIWQKQAQILRLNELEVPTKRIVTLKGRSTSHRNSRKIKNLKLKLGEENVILDNNKLILTEKRPLKEFLAGKIEFQDEKITFKSNNSVLFWQRPLKSQKGLLGKCTFENRRFFDKKQNKWIETGKSPAPLSHPEFELFRAYQFINNIRYGKNNTHLTAEQKEKVLNLMNKSDANFDFARIPKELKLTYEVFNYDDKLKVPGNTTHKKIAPFFTDAQWQQKREEIWHCFYFYEDQKMLQQKLMASFGLTEEEAAKASKMQLKDGYANVSLKAIRNINPFLERNYGYSLAVILGGVKNAFGSRWERFSEFHTEIVGRIAHLIKEGDFKEYELIEKLKAFLSDPDNAFGFSENDKSFQRLYHPSQSIEKKQIKRRLSEIENVRNPIVQKGLNEMRRLVNEILDKFSSKPEYGPDFSFHKIHVEMGRDLKNSKTKREEVAFRNRENEAANDDARLRLAEFGLKPGRDNLTKYRLFKEIEGRHGKPVCPYTNKIIKVSDLLGTSNLFQIEHIVPYSVSLDDGFMNKTLCESNFNREKGELTPYEFYLKNSDPKLWDAHSWEEIEQRAFAMLPFAKARKFTSKKKKDNSDFIERQLNDMRYISKKSAEILSEICDNVRVMPGQLTSELRRLWGLNSVLQPAFPLNLPGCEVDENLSIPHYLLLDNTGEPKIIIPVQAQRPNSSTNQILIPGVITDKKQFVADKSFRHLKLELKVENLVPGRYWAKVNIENTGKYTRIYTDKPLANHGNVVYRGKIEKGTFINDNLPNKIKTKEDDGIYWASIKVIETKLIQPQKDLQPKAGKNQIVLYGTVKDNKFTSWVYECKTELYDGKYWAILDVDFESINFSRAINPPDSDKLESLIITGLVGADGIFQADCDPTYNHNTTETSGKYFGYININTIEGFFPLENPAPIADKDEKVIEGNIWVNKDSGEILFDPKKNREDQRHHAVDAITIAFTELGYLQKLSRYFARQKDRERGIGDRPIFDKPWPHFDNDVKKMVDRILVSYAQNAKILSNITKTIVKEGVKYKSEGYSVRGRLHREFYFGKHPSVLSDSKDFPNKGILFEKDKNGNIVHYFHIRKSLNTIKNNKHVNKIVDAGIRTIIEDRLVGYFNIDISKAYNIPDGFFFDQNKQPVLYLKNKSGDPVPIKKVRMKEYIGNAAQLKSDTNQWVNPYNNHHVMLYYDYNGEMQEQVVSFWDVVERLKQGDEAYKLPEDGKQIIATLQENDMYLLGYKDDELEQIKRGDVLGLNMSDHLYRVQKISSMYYTFRHHLASTINNEEEENRIVSMRAWKEKNPCKVRVSKTGDLFI